MIMDPRHLHRIKIVQNLYAYSYNPDLTKLPNTKEKKTKQIIKEFPMIDKLINKYAPRYPLKNIARTDLSILRMSVYDLIFDKNIPVKVTIDEAVLLARELSGEKSYAFINAVLGSILNTLK